MVHKNKISRDVKMSGSPSSSRQLQTHFATVIALLCFGRSISFQQVPTGNRRGASSNTLTTCNAKLNKLASNFDLDEILSNEKQFSSVQENTSKRKRTTSKDRKRQMRKEALEKQKGNTHLEADDKNDIDEEVKSRHELLNSLAYEMHVVDDSEEGKRVDGMLVQLLNDDSASDAAISRSQCGSLLDSGCVFVVPQENASTLNFGTHLSYNQFKQIGETINKKSHPLEQASILIYPTRQSILSSPSLLTNTAPTEIIPQQLPLNIIYEDEHMIVLNKEAGMVVHPAAGNWDGTVVNALSYYLMNESPYGAGEFFLGEGFNDELANQEVDSFDDLEDETDDYFSNDNEINQNDAVTNSISSLRPGIVHRIDKGTTGVLVVAKTKSALKSLSEAFAQRRVKKQYLAVAIGNPGEDVRINKPIGRHPQHRQKMRVVPDPSTSSQQRLTGPKSSPKGRVALSHLRTLCHDGKLSLVQVQIATGRTHQIRVHLQDHGTPIYGDDVYGLNDWNKALSARRGITRPLLHAQRLEIDHPVTGERMVFQANVADDMMGVIEAIMPQGKDLHSLLHNY